MKSTRMIEFRTTMPAPAMNPIIEMIHDAGGKICACKATVNMFHLNLADFCPQMDKVLTVGEFYEISAGGQIIFT